jgi:hypothetical protein
MLRILTVFSVLTATLWIAACNSPSWPDRSPTLIEDADADSLVFWPPSMKYATTGETLVPVVMGLRRLYVCTDILELGWARAVSAAGNFLDLKARLLLPAHPTCALTTGLDTALIIPDSTPAGETLYLRTADGRVTDSLGILAGQTFTRSFTHVRSTADTVKILGGFTFFDSTAGRHQRLLGADSLSVCESLQAAVFDRKGDTVTVRFRLLVTPSPSCADRYSDTVAVVPNRFAFPWNAVPFEPPYTIP